MRIAPRDPSTLDEAGMALLDSGRSETGFLPDLLRLLAHSPVALRGYLALRASLRGSVLPESLREQIAIAVAAANGCDICLTSHIRFGRALGLSETALQDATRAHADDPASGVVLKFSRALIETRAHVDDDALTTVREAGFSDGAIIEIVALVALNVFANYVNALSTMTCALPASARAASAKP
jgi:uncharacterized peroxidase-related enzyme